MLSVIGFFGGVLVDRMTGESEWDDHVIFSFIAAILIFLVTFMTTLMTSGTATSQTIVGSIGKPVWIFVSYWVGVFASKISEEIDPL